jgi:4-aminobutyrate aminotransferase-like enzyme
MCWRTAFREVLKLKASLPDVENEYRLHQWLAVDNTQSKWSMKGAQDAVEFYDSKTGEPSTDAMKRVQAAALEEGLILLSCGVYMNTLRFLYPLTIQDNVFDEALDILDRALLKA